MTTHEKEALTKCKIGTKIQFSEEVRPYRVRARSERYLICTKPFNPRRTVLYTVVDLKERIRGTENLIFGFGAETDAECQNMVDRLDARLSEVSRRNRIPLSVAKVELANS